MFKLSNEEICFIGLLSENYLKNVNETREAVAIKKEIIRSFSKLESLGSNQSQMKEAVEKEIEKYDEIFHTYLDEKEAFIKSLYDKVDSLYEIIKENDKDAYDRANYFITDKPLTDMKNESKNNKSENE